MVICTVKHRDPERAIRPTSVPGSPRG